MKLYHCLLLICVVRAATVNEGNEAETDLCELQIEIIELKEKLCRLKLAGLHEFQSDYNTTMAKYNENGYEVPEIQEFANKYCGIAIEFIDCLSNSKPSEMVLKCEGSPAFRKIQPSIVKAIQTLATYSCDNNAENLKKLLPHDGFGRLFFNSDIDRCHIMSPSVGTVEEFCVTLDESRSCMVEVVRDHPNKDIAVMITEVFARAKTAAGC